MHKILLIVIIAVSAIVAPAQTFNASVVNSAATVCSDQNLQYTMKIDLSLTSGTANYLIEQMYLSDSGNTCFTNLRLQDESNYQFGSAVFSLPSIMNTNIFLNAGTSQKLNFFIDAWSCTGSAFKLKIDSMRIRNLSNNVPSMYTSALKSNDVYIINCPLPHFSVETGLYYDLNWPTLAHFNIVLHDNDSNAMNVNDTAVCELKITNGSSWGVSGSDTRTLKGTFPFNVSMYTAIGIGNLILDTNYYYNITVVINKKDTSRFQDKFRTGPGFKPKAYMVQQNAQLYKNAIVASGNCLANGWLTTTYFQYGKNNVFTKNGPVHVIDPNVFVTDYDENFTDTIVVPDSGTVYPFRVYAINQKGYYISSTMFLSTGGLARNGINSFENKFQMYPNPAYDLVHLQAEAGGHFYLFGSIGNVVISHETTGNEEYINFPDDMPKGVYCWKFILDSNITTGKLIVK